MRESANFLQLKDFTQDTAAKAVIASGGVVTASLRTLVCNSSETGALACSTFNGISDLLKILLAMMAMDLITGVMAARSEGQRISSRRLGVGTQRKVVMLLIVAAAVLIDGVLRAHSLPTGNILYSWTASWFIAVEALSLYENAGRLGVPLPKFLKSAIEALLQRAEQGGAAIVDTPELAADAVLPAAPVTHDTPPEQS